MAAGKIRHWKHGWIPVSPAAKAYAAGKGPKPVTGSSNGTVTLNLSVKNYKSMSNADKINAAATMFGSGSKQHKQAMQRFGKTAPKPSNGTQKPSVKSYKSMSNADKINAAATMFGSGSKQHKQAMQRFGQVAPNSKLGLPGSPVPRGDLDGAQRRATDIGEMLPGMPGGQPQPHYQFASQDMASHYTGGVVFNGDQIDFLLNKLQHEHEGPSNLADVKRAAGIPLDPNKGTPEQVAKRRARRLRTLLGGEVSASPHYDLPSGATAGEGKGNFTGGIYLRADQTDDLIKALAKRRTGPATNRDVRIAAGLN